MHRICICFAEPENPLWHFQLTEMQPWYTTAGRLPKSQAANVRNRPASKYVAGAMGFDMFPQGGTGNNSERATTNHATMQSACPHDFKASAADRKWSTGSVRTTQIDEREFFSPAQATP